MNINWNKLKKEWDEEKGEVIGWLLTAAAKALIWFGIVCALVFCVGIIIVLFGLISASLSFKALVVTVGSLVLALLSLGSVWALCYAEDDEGNKLVKL